MPIRLRLTLGFTGAMAVLFAITSLGLFWTMSTALLDEVDTGLRFRAATVQGDAGRSTQAPARALAERTESIVQIIGADGRLLSSSVPIGPVLHTTVTRPRFFTRKQSELGHTRFLALPLNGGRVAIVGASLSDRDDALRMLALILAIGGPVALALASLAGWRLAGSALDRSLRAERRFLDQASHELRTPLAILKTELDIALSRERTPDELRSALRSASDETDRLVRLANDLLVLSRAHGGELPVHRSSTSLRVIVDRVGERFRSRASSAGVSLVVDAPDVAVDVDVLRVEQALDNLVENSIRHAGRGTTVWLRGNVVDGNATLVVEDDGPGLAEPDDALGLGLRIVRAIASGHGGELQIGSRDDGGVRAAMRLPLSP